MFCDVFGNECFEKYMRNVHFEKTCDCPNECNTISYSYSIVSTPFDPIEMCPGRISSDFLMKNFYENKFPPKFIRKLMEFKTNVSSDDDDMCEKNIKYRAEILFTLTTNTLPVTVMSRRLSFFDKLSSFGRE